MTRRQLRDVTRNNRSRASTMPSCSCLPRPRSRRPCPYETPCRTEYRDPVAYDSMSQPQSVKAGRLLAGASLLEALQQEDRIFHGKCWAEDQIKGAGYELRLSGEYLVVPK